MAIDQLKIKPWGPARLRQIVKDIQNAINARTPVKGLGIEIDEQPTGAQISTSDSQPSASDDTEISGGGGSGGTPGDIEGALNGAPATYHILQSRPPTPR